MIRGITIPLTHDVLLLLDGLHGAIPSLGGDFPVDAAAQLPQDLRAVGIAVNLE